MTARIFTLILVLFSLAACSRGTVQIKDPTADQVRAAVVVGERFSFEAKAAGAESGKSHSVIVAAKNQREFKAAEGSVFPYAEVTGYSERESALEAFAKGSLAVVMFPAVLICMAFGGCSMQ